MSSTREGPRCRGASASRRGEASTHTGWSQERVDNFTYHPEDSDHSIVPARCPKLKGVKHECPCGSGEKIRDLLAEWPGPPPPWRDWKPPADKM